LGQHRGNKVGAHHCCPMMMHPTAFEKLIVDLMLGMG
jgi:hypothetical protein